MAGEDKTKEQTTAAVVRQINTTGLTAAELASLLGPDKLREFIQPAVSALAVGGANAPLMDRDISGHIHTTG